MANGSLLNDTGWQVVNAKKRKISFEKPTTSRKTTCNSGRDSANIFDVLSDEESDTYENEREKMDTTGHDKESNPPKPPPIVIPGVTDINRMIRTFKTLILTSEFSYSTMRDGQIRVTVTTSNAYRSLVDHLDKNNMMYHSYQMKQQKAYRVVIKNIHHTTPADDIKHELLLLGHAVRNIINVKSRITKEPLPIFYVDLEPDQNNKKIYEIKYLTNAVIKVEPPRRNHDLVQCHRCQQFGHTKSYCKKAFRCVKCGLEHATVDCQKPKEEPPRCIHCSQNHTASYKGCKVYRELVNKKNIIIQNRREVIHDQIPYFIRSNDISYAQAAKSNFNENSNANTLSKIEELINKQIDLTNSLVKMISTLIAKLCK